MKHLRRAVDETEGRKVFFPVHPPSPSSFSGSDGEKHQNNNSRWLPVEDWLITEEKILHSSLSDSTKKKKKNANKMRTQFISFLLHRLPPCFLHPPDFVLINEKDSWIFIAAKRKPQRIKHKNLWRSWWHFWFPQPQSRFSVKNVFN